MSQKFIQKSEEAGYLLIDNCIKLDADIYEEGKKCSKCNSSTIYHATFDALFCAFCNIWLEKKCSDLYCDYCSTRPERPLPSEQERRNLRNSKKQIIYPEST